MPWPVWSGSSNAIYVTPAGGCTCPARAGTSAAAVPGAEELHQRLGRSPTTLELAEHLELGEEEVLEGLAAAGSRLEVSLDQPAGDEGDLRLGDLVAAPAAREEPEDL